MQTYTDGRKQKKDNVDFSTKVKIQRAFHKTSEGGCTVTVVKGLRTAVCLCVDMIRADAFIKR